MNTFNPDYYPCPKCSGIITDLIADYKQCYGELQAENKQLRDCLQWYADEQHIKYPKEFNRRMWIRDNIEHGQKARDAVKAGRK